MNVDFLVAMLFIIAGFTNLSVEGLKTFLDRQKIAYSSNILAAVVAVLTALAVSVIYMILFDVDLTLKIGVQIAILMWGGFLISTVGYDKIIQTVMQTVKTKSVKKGE